MYPALRKKCTNTAFFMVRIFSYLNWIRTRKKSLFRHILRSVEFSLGFKKPSFLLKQLHYLSKAWNLINSFWTPAKWNIPELQLLPQVLKIRQGIIKSKDFFTTSKTITFFVVIFKSNFVGAPSIKENCTRFQFIRAEKDMSFSVISLCFFLYFKIGKNAVSDINITTRKT